MNMPLCGMLVIISKEIYAIKKPGRKYILSGFEASALAVISNDRGGELFLRGA